MTRSRWTDEMEAAASKMWASGSSAREIAGAVGVTRSSLLGYTVRHRHRFPHRTREEPAAPVSEVVVAPVIAEPVPKRSASWIGGRHVPRVPYTTITGAVVSLPHVSILNGKEA
jgi:hypothetical protein